MTWLVLLALGAGNLSTEDIRAPSWAASVEMGAGQLEEDPAALLRPHLALTTPDFELTLGAPLFLRLEDQGPLRRGGPTDGRRQVLFDTSDPEAYLAVVHRFDVASDGGGFRLGLGTLTDTTLGSGVLVSRFAGSLDVAAPRTGGQLTLANDSAALTLLASSFARPSLVAASLRLLPLVWGGLGDDLRLYLEAAVDPRAAARVGSAPAGGGDVTLEYALYEGENVGLGVYAAAAMLHRRAVGAQAGLRAELTEGGRGRDSGIVVRVEGVHGGKGYVPSYFDEAYVAERAGLASELSPKRARVAAAGEALALALDGRLGPVRAGAYGRSDLRGRTVGMAYLGVSTPTVDVSAVVMQRALGAADDLFRFDATSAAWIDASATLTAGLYAFTHLGRTWREEPSRPARVAGDWVVGVGYGAEDYLN